MTEDRLEYRAGEALRERRRGSSGLPERVIETPRLLLRMFQSSDLDAYAEMCADPEVMRYLGAGQCLSRADAWRHLAMVLGHWRLRGYGFWAVQERSSGEMVGRVGCWWPEGWPGFELGWTLRRSYWGKGYATEAARASLSDAFTELDQPHVISLIDPANVASIKLAERLGERLEGQTRLRDREVLVYGIGREDWIVAGRSPRAAGR